MWKGDPEITSLFTGDLAGIYRFMRILGVGKKELEIYSLLLSHPGMTVNEISQMLGAPTPKIYDALSKLLSRKWVYKTNERPSRYYSIPIRELWDDIKLTIEDQLKEVDEKVIPILEKMTTSPMPLFRVLLIEQSRIPYFMKRVMSRARSELYIALSYPELLSRKNSEQIKAVSLSKNVRIIVSRDLEQQASKKLGKNIEYRVAERLFGSGIIGDEILLIVKSASELNALWSDHAYFVDLGRIYFRYIWENSSPA